MKTKYLIPRVLIALSLVTLSADTAEASFIKGWIDKAKEKREQKRVEKRRDTVTDIVLERRTSAMYVQPVDPLQGEMPDVLDVPQSRRRERTHDGLTPAHTGIPEIAPITSQAPPVAPAVKPAATPATVIIPKPAGTPVVKVAPELVKENPYGIPELHKWPFLSLDDHMALTLYKEQSLKDRGPTALRSPFDSDALLENYMFSIMSSFSGGIDLQPGVPLSQIIGRNIKHVLNDYLRMQHKLLARETTIDVIAGRAAQNPLVSACARDILAKSYEPYGKFTLFDTDLIVPGPAVSGYSGTWYSDDPEIYLRNQHYKFVDVKVAEPVGSLFDVAIKVSKRVSLEQPDTWQELTLNFPISISDIRKRPEKIRLHSGDYQLILRYTHFARWGQHTVNDLIKNRWSLEEYLRLSLRIPAPGHDDVGYLCQYHPKALNLLLLPRELEPLFPIAQKDFLRDQSCDGVSTFFSSVADEYMHILKHHGFESEEGHKFTATLLHYSEFIKGRKNPIPMAESEKNTRVIPVIRAFMKHSPAQAIYENLMTEYLYEGYTSLYQLSYSNGIRSGDSYNFRGTISDYVSRLVKIRLASRQLSDVEEQWPLKMLQWCGLNVSEDLTPSEASTIWKQHFDCDVEDAIGQAAVIHQCSGHSVSVFETKDKATYNPSSNQQRDILCTLYRHILPFTPTFQIGRDVAKGYVARLVRGIIGPNGKPVSIVRQEIERDVQAILDHERKYGFLKLHTSTELIARFLNSHDGTRDSTIEELDRTIKEKLTREEKSHEVINTFISHVTEYWDGSQEPFKATYRAACVQWIYDNPEDLSTIDDGLKAYEAILQAKHTSWMQLGYFTEKECYRLVFETDFKDRSREGAVLQVMQNKYDPWPNTFLNRNGFTGSETNLNLLAKYTNTVATLLAEAKGPQDWQEGLRQHRREWCSSMPKIKELHVPPAMLDEVVEDLASDDGMKLEDALSKQVPKFYRALLGPHAQETQEAQASAARGLAQGYDFPVCHQLAFTLSQSAWLRIALKFMDLSAKASEIPEVAITKAALDKFAKRLAKEKIDDRVLWSMHPVELGCRFRQVNGLQTAEFLKNRQERLKVVAAKRKEKQEFVDQLIKARRDVDKALSKTDHLWALDGRNPKYHDRLVTELDKVKQEPISMAGIKQTFKLSLRQLKCDPYLKQMLVDELVKKDISDDKYKTMLDTLCALAREFIKEPDDKYRACFHIGRFFRVAIRDARQFLEDGPAIPDHLMRKRIFLVYDRVFEPLLATGMRESAYHELETVIRNSDTCIDAARRTLMKMEEHPNMYGATQSLSLFDRIGNILKNCRLQAIEATAKARATKLKKQDVVEYDMFMRNAFGLGLSLGVEPCAQLYLDFTRYIEDYVAEDTTIFLNNYVKTMFDAVTKAIRYNSKPSGDADPTHIYMEDIVDWAINQSQEYANTFQPDVDLMEKGQIRPKVVVHLLEDAGYLERLK